MKSLQKPWKVVWWYAGGMLNTELTSTKDKAETFARDIRNCGGTANIYHL